MNKPTGPRSPSTMTVVAVGAHPAGREPVRYVLRDVESRMDRVLVVREGDSAELYPAVPSGAALKYGYWDAPTEAQSDAASLLERYEIVELAPGRGAGGGLRGPEPLRHDIGGGGWTRAQAPLGSSPIEAVRLVSDLRAASGGYPLSVVAHTKSCTPTESEFLADLLGSQLIRFPDRVWFRGPQRDRAVGLPRGQRVVDDKSPFAADYDHRGTFDLVVFSGDEPVESLPSDAFVGRTRAVVVEAVGMRAAQLVDRFAGEDVVTLVSYWTNPRLWEAFSTQSDPWRLVDCIVKLTSDWVFALDPSGGESHLSAVEHGRRVSYALTTAATILNEQEQDLARVRAEVERRLINAHFASRAVVAEKEISHVLDALWTR